MLPDEIKGLLNAEESETLEKKASLADEGAIRRSMIAFANDLAGRGGGKIVIGQEPTGRVVGLKVGGDEAQRTISNLARTRCFPAIPISIDMCDYKGALVAIVTVKTSVARPHFRGECFVRQGSTNRSATDAEIMVLRYATVNPKIRQLMNWIQEGNTTITCEQLPVGLWGRAEVEIVALTDTYIALKYSSSETKTVSLDSLELGYDYQKGRPLIRFSRES